VSKKNRVIDSTDSRMIIGKLMWASSVLPEPCTSVE
jgi:hypothetical protein